MKGLNFVHSVKLRSNLKILAALFSRVRLKDTYGYGNLLRRATTIQKCDTQRNNPRCWVFFAITYAESHDVQCHYAECNSCSASLCWMLTMLSGILANVINPECHFAECRYSECRYACALTDIAKKILTFVQYGKINKFENTNKQSFSPFLALWPLL